MAKISKRRKEFLGKYDLTKPFALNEALDAVKACATPSLTNPLTWLSSSASIPANPTRLSVALS